MVRFRIKIFTVGCLHGDHGYGVDKYGECDNVSWVVFVAPVPKVHGASSLERLVVKPTQGPKEGWGNHQ